MADFTELIDVNPDSLDDVLCDEPQPEEQYEMGRLEAKLEAARDKLVEKFPFLEKAIGGNFDIKIGISQGLGTLIPTIAVNLAFYLTPAATASYIGIMVGRFLAGFATIAGTYFATHYLLNDKYKGRGKELLNEAIRFTTMERGTFIPTRVLSLCLESVLVGSLGWSRYFVGNCISPFFTALQTFGCNYSGKNLAEGYTMRAAIKQGFKDLGYLLGSAIRLPYTLGKKAYDFVFNREEPLPYPIDSPEEYIADWHASRTADPPIAAVLPE